MNRKDLLDQVLSKYEEKSGKASTCTRKELGTLVEVFLDEVVERVKSEGKFYLGSLGTLKAKTRKARLARNPRTGEKVKVPAKKTMTLKPATSVLEYLAK